MTILLKVVSFNIDYSIGGVKILSTEAWIAIFSFVILIMRGNVLIQKRLIPVIVYALVVGLMDLSGHLQNAAAVWFKTQVLPVFITSVIFEIYAAQEEKNSKKILLVAVVFISVSLILNIIGLYRYPYAVRQIVSGSGGVELAIDYASLGIEGYGFFSGLPPLIPVLVLLYRRTPVRFIKLASLWSIVLIAIAITLSTITTPLLIMVLGLLTSLMIGTYYSKVRAIVVSSLVLLTLIQIGPVGMTKLAISTLSDLSPSEEVDTRLADIDYALAGNFEVDSTTQNLTTLEYRIQRIFWNINTFLSNPLVGSSSTNEYGAFHLFWLYMLASIGIIGAIPFFVFLVLNVSRSTEGLPQEERLYYILSIVMFVSMGMIKNVGGWFMYFVPFYLVPAILKWHLSSKAVHEFKDV